MKANQRIPFLDAARGIAMFFVLLAHFGGVFFRAPEDHQVLSITLLIGRVASPMFVMLSGILLGVLYAVRHPSQFVGVQRKLVDRGLFLLLIGHPLICCVLFPSQGTLLWSLSTDAIGVALICGSFLVPQLNIPQRLLSSAAAFALGWLIAARWTPVYWHDEFLKETLFGDPHLTVFRSGSFPLLQWVAVYLASTCLGERLALLYAQGHAQRAVFELRRLAALCFSSATFLKVGTWVIGGGGGGRGAHDSVASAFEISRLLLRIDQKYPPGPIYLLVFGGFALLGLSLSLQWNVSGHFRRTMSLLARCGECSLFIFITHFYVYWILLYSLGPGHPAAALFYFPASVVLLGYLALRWHAGGGNRFLTVGYPQLIECLQRNLSTALAANRS